MHLTPGEQQVMDVFWQTQIPLTQGQVIEQCTNRNWKERSIFSLINGLLRKGLIREAGFTRSGKTYARTFEARITQPEYWANYISQQIPESDYPALLAAIHECTPLDKKPGKRFKLLLII